MSDRVKNGLAWCAFICIVLLIVAFPFWAWPQYRVWQQGLEGEARLARAEQEKQIQVTQAQAEVEVAECFMHRAAESRQTYFYGVAI